MRPKELNANSQVYKTIALQRSSIYRKCRVEELKLPLLQGNLNNVPMEENLHRVREEVAMDVDEDRDQSRNRNNINAYDHISDKMNQGI
ncbi:hypothetical protein JOM56_001107 [Amanita muscaria]